MVFPVGYRRGVPLWRAVRDNRPVDVLHLHWTECYTGDGNRPSLVFRWVKLLVDLALVRISGVRVVWTLHNILPHECRHPGLERFFRRRLANSVSQVLAHGESSRRAAEDVLHCSSTRIAVAPHGHYRSVYPPATAEMRREGRVGLSNDHRVFLFFGMMRPYKGLERLLRVWRKLKPQQATLRLAGPCLDPDYQTELRALVGETPGTALSCGFSHADEVSRIFAPADVVVLPFEQVQTSGSVILALSFGKPVIAPRLGEIPETLQTATDLMYEPGADASLEEAIRRALERDLERLSAQSAEACKMLEWDMTAARTVACYREAAPRLESSLSAGLCAQVNSDRISLDESIGGPAAKAS